MAIADPPSDGPLIGDAYGRLLRAYHDSGEAAEIIERDDGYVSPGMDAGRYFLSPAEWPARINQALEHTHGRVLDIGCGAGQHAIALREDGLDVVGIDLSAGAVEVCRDRGLESIHQRGIGELEQFDDDAFETILLLGNNFGLVENKNRAPAYLEGLARITSEDARLIAESRNPYTTNRDIHLAYHDRNRSRDVLGGRLIIRARYERYATDWFEYLIVSPKEMESILEPTAWSIETSYHEDNGPQYIAILGK